MSINPTQLSMLSKFIKKGVNEQEEELSRAGTFLALRRKHLKEQYDLIKEYEGRWKTTH